MIKREYENQTRTITQDFLVYEKRYCDHCGKEITGKHFQVTTGCNDWGKLSSASVVDKDYCSIDCLEHALRQYYEASINRKGPNTEYFEIQHVSDADVEGEIEYD